MKIYKLIILSLLILFITGCSGPVGDFFTVRYQNFMGYFNTYYNAKKNFDEAVLEIQKNPPKGLDTNYFAQYIATPTVKTKFNLVLEKASKVIQFYPKSKWVDDAIMLIGETYYYEDEVDLALKKFEELTENFPESKYYWKANNLYARTLYYNEEYDEATRFIDRILPDALQKDEDIALELSLLKAQIYYEQMQYIKALNTLDEALKLDADGYLLAFGSYMAGRINEVIQNYELAKISYQNILNYKPDNNLKFKAKLNFARMLRELGDYESALKYFSDMREDEINSNNLSYIDLEIALTYDKMGDYENALYKYELVDSLYKKTDASAKSFYYRGLMYERVNDYNEAKFYFDKAKSEFPQSEITAQAQKKTEIFTKLLEHRNEIIKLDSIYQKLIDTSNISLIDTTKTIKDTTEISNVLTEDNVSSVINDSTMVGIIDTLSEVLLLEEDFLLEPQPDKVEMQQNLQTKSTQITHRQISPDSLLYLIANRQLELGTIFFLDLGLIDSAEYWLLKVIESKHKDKFAPKAYYTLMEIYKQKGDEAKSDSFFNRLISEYPGSEYSAYVQKIRGIETKQEEQTELQAIYEKALNSIDNKKPNEAIKILRNICRADSASTYCIKSIYTTGWIYENLLNKNDSAHFYYRILIDKYPNSIYAKEIVNKVAVAEDTSKLSQIIKIKEIIPPPPPVPKYVQTEQRDIRRNIGRPNVGPRTDIRSRDIREEDYEEPDYEEPEIDEDEPPE